ncbi:MAG: dCMP deaminase family protein [Bacteriovoracaceae bacterium]|jgi:dCMP deaminase|nr:dCMP deaminase family protein [Bacteriovoracaceae bacterium]
MMNNENINFIEAKSKLNWDEYFMLQAMIAAFKSKDPATKVGSVFVDQNNHQITMGYNGFIAGIDETKLPWGKDRSVGLEHQKYGYVVHSEANAILHATRSLEGAKAYVTLFPCNECAKLIASSKVKEVIFLSDKHRDTEENRIAKKIFELSGVSYRKLDFRPEILGHLVEHLNSQLVEL